MALLYYIIYREVTKETHDTTNKITSPVTKNGEHANQFMSSLYTRDCTTRQVFLKRSLPINVLFNGGSFFKSSQAHTKTRISFPLEHNDVIERSLLTNVLSNGGSFYLQEFSNAYKVQQRSTFTDLIILIIASPYFTSCKLFVPYFVFGQSYLRMRQPLQCCVLP